MARTPQQDQQWVWEGRALAKDLLDMLERTRKWLNEGLDCSLPAQLLDAAFTGQNDGLDTDGGGRALVGAALGVAQALIATTETPPGDGTPSARVVLNRYKLP